jgi:hypothetical protein
MVIDRAYLCRFDSSRYPRAYLYGRVSEKQVQSDIIQMLALRFRLTAYSIDSGGQGMRGAVYRSIIRSGVSVSLARAIVGNLDGIPPAPVGHPDLVTSLAPSGRAIYIEVKRPAGILPDGKIIQQAGSPSPEQLSFLDKKYREGCIVGVAWSANDVVEIIGIDLLNKHLSTL